MKFKTGDKYIIRFHDHCLDDFKMICECMLKITREDKTHIYGTWWVLITEDKDVEENNREMISIIKSTIISKRKVK